MQVNALLYLSFFFAGSINQILTGIQNSHALKGLGFLNTVKLNKIMYDFPSNDMAIADN